MCFSAMCSVRGNLLNLIRSILNCSIYAAMRIVDKHESPLSLAEQVEDLMVKDELPSFDIDIANRMADDLWDSPGHEYMRNRGYSDTTLAFFQVGYSQNKRMVVLPMHDWDGKLVGVIGRSIDKKVYKNSKNLPTKKLLFNAHRAKRVGEKIIVVESAMDVMKLHEAGFKNVVSTNGGFFTEHHQQIINRYFNELVIMTDLDDPEEHRSVYCRKCEDTCLGHSPGRALGEKIAHTMQHKTIRWASYDHMVVYPHGAKDPGDMTMDEIRQCVDNSISTLEYEYWKKELPLLARI